MTEKINLNEYQKFVEEITSPVSNNIVDFKNRVEYLNQNSDINVPLLLTSGIGLNTESGEFLEVLKKIFFHDKPVTEEKLEHLISELGDVIWYWTNACRALKIDPNEVIARNIKKLESRHPSGKFTPNYNQTE